MWKSIFHNSVMWYHFRVIMYVSNKASIVFYSLSNCCYWGQPNKWILEQIEKHEFFSRIHIRNAVIIIWGCSWNSIFMEFVVLLMELFSLFKRKNFMLKRLLTYHKCKVVNDLWTSRSCPHTNTTQNKWECTHFWWQNNSETIIWWMLAINLSWIMNSSPSSHSFPFFFFYYFYFQVAINHKM